MYGSWEFTKYSDNKITAPTYVTTQLRMVEIIFSQKIKRGGYFVKFVCPMKNA
jgi:hypothetical protein